MAVGRGGRRETEASPIIATACQPSVDSGPLTLGRSVNHSRAPTSPTQNGETTLDYSHAELMLLPPALQVREDVLQQVFGELGGCAGLRGAWAAHHGMHGLREVCSHSQGGSARELCHRATQLGIPGVPREITRPVLGSPSSCLPGRGSLRSEERCGEGFTQVPSDTFRPGSASLAAVFNALPSVEALFRDPTRGYSSQW